MHSTCTKKFKAINLSVSIYISKGAEYLDFMSWNWIILSLATIHIFAVVEFEWQV